VSSAAAAAVIFGAYQVRHAPEENAMSRIIAAALFALLAAGCASTVPTSEGMIPAFTVRGVRGPVHPEPVAIEVKSAGAIPGPAFRQALADAVTLSRVFPRVAASGPYVLSV